MTEQQDGHQRLEDLLRLGGDGADADDLVFVGTVVQAIAARSPRANECFQQR